VILERLRFGVALLQQPVERDKRLSVMRFLADDCIDIALEFGVVDLAPRLHHRPHEILLEIGNVQRERIGEQAEQFGALAPDRGLGFLGIKLEPKLADRKLVHRVGCHDV